MPTYGYRCSNCKHELEKLQKMSDDPLKHCPECKKETLIRIPSRGIGLSFSGSGFYVNDYGEKKGGAPTTPGSCCPCGKNKNSCGSS